jgi:hypothetical protein
MVMTRTTGRCLTPVQGQLIPDIEIENGSFIRRYKERSFNCTASSQAKVNLRFWFVKLGKIEVDFRGENR